MDPNRAPIPEPVIGDARPRSKSRHEGMKSVFSTVAILIIAPLIALALTTYVFQSYEVDGPSMETTLQNQDRLIVLKVPRTLARITNNPYIPERGDVVIFTHHEASGFGTSGNRQLIKRVVALPGERVVIKDGVLKVFNSQNPDGFEPDHTLPYGSVIGETTGDVDIVIPKGRVYVCGDNRSNSLDSRSFGPISADDIVGKLLFRVFPLNKADLF